MQTTSKIKTKVKLEVDLYGHGGLEFLIKLPNDWLYRRFTYDIQDDIYIGDNNRND